MKILKISGLRILFLISLQIFTSGLIAQITISNGSIINISNNTPVCLEGNLLCNGHILNSGVVSVSGDWINYGEYIDSDGLIFLNGLTNQIFDNNNSLVSMLRINSEQVNLGSNVFIATNLDLIQGNIITGNDYLVQLNRGANVTSASESSYVQGRFRCQGEGILYFPVGTDQMFLPAWLNGIDNTQTLVEFTVQSPNQNLRREDELIRVTESSFWRLTNISNTDLNTRVTLQYDNTMGLDVVDNLVIAEAASGNSTFNSLGCSELSLNNSGGLITSRLNISQNIFTIGELGSEIIISNVLTPNGDGVNDILYIENIENYSQNKFLILNRLGQVIYSQNNYNNDWDGSVDKERLPAGNYVCIIELQDISKTFNQMFSILY